jgi:hypothetical protein
MNYKKFGNYLRVLVTGPQRSGTTFMAKTIASELEYRYVDEIEFKWYNKEIFKQLLLEEKIVIQCPTMCRWIHEFSNDSILVVMMIRPIGDILKSQKRISWKFEYIERANYADDSIFSCEAKYKFWHQVQKNIINNFIEINYDSLKDDPRWVDPDQRKKFSAKQTKIIKIL